ncbi:uncharacterized protein LOC112638527 isoform X1 [Camponotus floridanus]|uniref:uncharacterized protein LOC112638083 isoform X1 n=1 Tax=Camponotus floridanus TaxID=104421 RepID=UPI000DC6A185|nr:uncharacterized protein LOC112638083 isoform X1 [Camponotus floridanus]XP_025266190.1 uncharacterized protein LOC112638527 isoform X1 [Camponotus floridanus]
MLFLNSSAALRTDENFIKRIDENHHTGTSLFEEADLGMVSQFPLDYMHLVCLGAVKKILQKDRTIVRIKNICLDHDEKPILIGELLMNSVAFPNYPIDSKEFDIAVGNQWSQQTIINANNVSKKAVCIPYNKSYCFLPLLHSSN